MYHSCAFTCFCFLIYRGIWWLFYFFNAFCIRSRKQLEKLTAQCEIMRILFRKKIHLGDMARDSDFLCWHERFAEANTELMHSNWTLYTVSQKFAYFVLLPNPVEEYTARKVPFFFVSQFTDAQKVARMSLGDFLKFSEEVGPPKSSVIVLHGMVRSGTTLLSQMLQVGTGQIVVLGEPSYFTALSVAFEEWQHLPLETLDYLIVAGFNLICKNMKHQDQIYILKVQAFVAKLVPLVKRNLPEIKHLFLYRKVISKAVKSTEKMYFSSNMGPLLLELPKVCEKVANLVVGYSECEAKIMRKVNPINSFEWSLTWYLTPFKHYKNHVECFSLPMVMYESLVSDTEKNLKRIYKVCGISEEFVEEGMSCMSKHSQEDTLIDPKVLADVTSTEQLGTYNQKRVKQIARIVEFPVSLLQE